MTPFPCGRGRAGGVAPVATIAVVTAAVTAALCLGLSLLPGDAGLRTATDRLAVQARPAPGAAPAAAPPGAAPVVRPSRRRSAAPGDPTFSIATFNVLGSQHTRGRSGYAGGRTRARVTAGLVEAKGLDVIGLQEVQDDQLRVLRRALPGYSMWPRHELGEGGVRLQVAWRTDTFSFVRGGSIDTPFDKQVRPTPWVVLRHRGTGREIYVIDTHNSPRGQEAERDAATAQQLALVDQLRATRQAVFFLGDMNEKREIFCQVVSKTSLVAANGGSARSKRDCTLPTGRLHIDWIFGGGPVAFTGFHYYDGADVRRASDHALIRAQVAVRPRR